MEEEYILPDESSFKLGEDVKKLANTLFAQTRPEAVKNFLLIISIIEWF